MLNHAFDPALTHFFRLMTKVLLDCIHDIRPIERSQGRMSSTACGAYSMP
jgi:hypothetical protein